MNSHDHKAKKSRVDDLSRRIDNLDHPNELLPAADQSQPGERALDQAWDITGRWVKSIGIFVLLMAIGLFVHFKFFYIPDPGLKYKRSKHLIALKQDTKSSMTAESASVKDGDIIAKFLQHDENRDRIDPRIAFKTYLIDSDGNQTLAEGSCRFAREGKFDASYSCAIPVDSSLEPGSYQLRFLQFDGIGFNDATTEAFTITSEDHTYRQ